MTNVTIKSLRSETRLPGGVLVPAYTTAHIFTIRVGNTKLKNGAALDKRCGAA